MGFEELLFRSGAMLSAWHEEGIYTLGLKRNPTAPLFAPGEGIVFRNPWLDSGDLAAVVARLQSAHPEYIQKIKKEADQVCGRQFTLFGDVVRYGSRIAWRADPISGKEWPASFHTRIDIFSGNAGIGDVKYVWELNRHQFLAVLGKAYLLTGDEKYAAAGLEMMEDWVRENPYKIGINWASALEVAIRSLSWCWACALFQDAKEFGPARRRTLLDSLYQHGGYIEEHLSFFFSPYNHLIGEATALLVLGGLLPQLRPAERWKEKGWAILEAEMPRQFHPDGGTVEQATGYHHFTLGFYLQAFLLRRRLGLAVPSGVGALLEKGFEFSMQMMRPDGMVPMIGDGDEGKAIDLFQPSLWDFRPFLAIGAALFQRGDLKKMAGPFPPDAMWLLHRKDLDRYEALVEMEPTEKSKALSKSGYYIMRTGWDREAHYLNFDCGEIAAGVSKSDLPSAAHGHADALSIEVSAYGEPLLIDPGFYTYNGPVEWHRIFRETQGHNSVVVDGRSQAHYSGRLKWSRAPEVECRRWIRSARFDYVEGSHDGYSRLPQPVIHRRSVAFLKPEYWLIRDELIGAGEHEVDRYFHFSPLNLINEVKAKSIFGYSAAGSHLAVIPIEKEGVTVEILNGGEGPEGGWLAIGYGKKVRAPIARYRVKASLPITLHTLLVPFKEKAPDMAIEMMPSDSPDKATGRAFVVEGEKGTDLFSFARSQGKHFPYKGWISDAEATWIRLDKSGGFVCCALIGGASLFVDGTALLQLDKKVKFAAVSFENGKPLIELSEPAVVVSSPFPELRTIILHEE